MQNIGMFSLWVMMISCLFFQKGQPVCAVLAFYSLQCLVNICHSYSEPADWSPNPNTSRPCYDANAIYQHLEKFDREKKKKKSQSVRQDSNPLYTVPYIRAQAQALCHKRCCCWQPLFQLFYRQTLHNPAPPTLTLLSIHKCMFQVCFYK